MFWIWLALASPITTSPALAINQTQTDQTQTDQTEKDYEKALMSFHDKDDKSAKIYLRNALKRNSHHLPARILMAKMLIREGDGAAAEIELNFARERGADYNQLVVLFGYAYILQAKNQYLLDVIRNGKRDNSIEAEISYLRGRAYFGQKQLANAKRSFKESLRRNPDLHKAELGLAQVAAVHKQYDLALQYINTIIARPNPDQNAFILKAKIYKQHGTTQQAIKAINEALAIDDTNVMSRLTRAALYIDLNKYDEADKDVDFILDKIPREPRAKYLKTIIASAKGDTKTSKANMIEIINTLQSIPPKMMRAHPTYYYLAGLANFQFGNIDEARKNLHLYLKLEHNDISAMRVLGALELQDGDPLAANVVLAEAARMQPNNPTILTMLGMVYMELGNVEKANYYLERVTKLLPQSPKSLTNLARGKLVSGAFDEAIANLLKAEQHNLDSIDIKLLLAEAYQQSKQYGKAVGIIKALKDKEPESAFLLNLYGTAVGLLGDHKEARKSYLRALELDKTSVITQIHLSRMDVIEGHVEKALADLHKHLKELPDNYILMQELGNIYTLKKDAKNALFWYQKAYSLDANDFTILNSLVSGYLINNNVTQALKVTSDYLNRFPKNTAAYNLSGQLYERANEPTKAIKAYKLATKYAKKRGTALLSLANAQLRNNDRKAAMKTLQKALTWNPNLKDAYIGLIRIATEDADSENGFALLKHLRDITKKDDPAPDILTGDLYAALKQYKNAGKSYQAALNIGDNPLAIMGLYRAYLQSQQMNKAIAILEGWYAKYPEDLRAALSLGNAYKRDGQIEKSAAFHDKLLKTNPNMPLLLNNAASVNYAIGNMDKAWNYARQAYAIMPDNANILDTLAWIETGRGAPETALPLLRKALVLSFSDPEIKYHLALTLDKLNRRGEAMTLLIEAIKSRNTFLEKKHAKKILAQWKQK